MRPSPPCAKRGEVPPSHSRPPCAKRGEVPPSHSRPPCAQRGEVPPTGGGGVESNTRFARTLVMVTTLI